jgi:hypothetical protein
VVVIENHPDGTRDDPDLDAALVASTRRECEFRWEPAYWVAKNLGRGFYKMTAFDSATLVALKVQKIVDGQHGQAEAAVQADLLRCVVGNPFHPAPSPDPAWLSWNDGLVLRLATDIYEHRRFEDLPLLADALVDAGCSDAQILGHVRGRGLTFADAMCSTAFCNWGKMSEHGAERVGRRPSVGARHP